MKGIGRGLVSGSSPRVRSGLDAHGAGFDIVGIISACAERTTDGRCTCRWNRDHLRVCGADSNPSGFHASRRGSSPRVRSGPRSPRRRRPGPGIISACAERTISAASTSKGSKDHLRVCGADRSTNDSQDNRTGSSPRVRSGRPVPSIRHSPNGIISACAERTAAALAAAVSARDHLRVCGADNRGTASGGQNQGSSPRVRSGPHCFCFRHRELRIISACAERTWLACQHRRSSRDHLRVCGADVHAGDEITHILGSSPRVRSRQGSARLAYSQARDHLRVCGADSEA